MKSKLPKLSTIRNKCDNLLTPLVIKLHPHCLLCGNDTQVAHHHYHKSKSNRLRYELDNLIPLCASCHFKLHQNESYWGSRVTELIGKKRWNRLQKLAPEIIKIDVHYYMEQYEKLKQLYETNE